MQLLGYKKLTQEVTIVSGQTVTLDFDLNVDILQMEEVVVTGVASRNSKAVATIAVQRINTEELTEKVSFNSVHELLSGKVAGVSLQRSGGGFGAGTRFIVRSGGGINGSGQPLIFVDGVRMSNNSFDAGRGEGGGISSLVGLNPEDIANVEIIKGPAGSASYGTGAANGVVLITTKRGTSSKKWEVNYKATLGFNDLRKLKERDFRNYQYMNDNFFKSGQIWKNSFNVSGGSDEIRAFFSVDHNKEAGHTPASDFEQTSARLNLDFNPSPKFSIKVSTHYSISDIAFPQRGRGDGEFGYLTFVRTNYNPDFTGPFNSTFFDGREEDLNTINSFTGSLTARYKPFVDDGGILGGLSAGFTIGIADSQNRNLYVQQKTTEEVEGEDNPGERSIAHLNTKDVTFTADAALNYSFGEFSGTSAIGTQILNARSHQSFASRSDFATTLISTINAGELDGGSTESSNHFREAGIFTSHHLSYEDTYLASFLVRQDYASVLGSLTSSIVYPAASVAVRWDKFDWVPEIFSILKTRIAYGESGTLPGRTDGIPLLWDLGESQYGVGSNLSSFGNPELKPERVKQWEFGLDAEIGNFGLEFTYYRENVSESIIPKANVPSSGQNASSPLFNIGTVEGSGWETQLHASFAGKSLGGWRVNFTLTNAFQENTVTSMGGAGQITAGAGGGRQVYRVGLPKGAYYNEIALGALFSDGTNEQELEFAPGGIVPEGGIYDIIFSDGDVFIGTNTPKYTGSLSANLSIGNFDFYALTEWKTGFYIYNEQVIDQIFTGADFDFFDGIGTNSFQYDKVSDQLGFSNFGTGATVLTTGTQAYTDAANLYAATSPTADANVIQPGDFLKIRELSLSYNFKKLISKSKFIKGLRIGVSGSNLFSWYKRKASKHTVVTDDGQKIERWIAGYSGLDSEGNAFGFSDSNGPQSGIQSATLPQARTFTTFIALKF